jgi:hypothetical protein
VYENLFHAHSEWLGLETLRILGVTLASGAAISILAAILIILMIRRFLIPEYLHGFVFLGLAIAVFTISNFIADEAGLVSVTLLGIVVANQRWFGIEHIIEFKENLRIFLVSGLFIVLGSQLRLSEIAALGWPMLVFLLVLIFVVRPASVGIALLGTQTTWKERVFLAFLAPRGIVAAAVTSVFALRIAQLDEIPVTLGQLAQLVPVTFTVIIGTVAFYGLTAAPLARRLGLADANPQGVLFAGADAWVRDFGQVLRKCGFSVAFVDTNFGHVAAAKMEGMPAYCASILSENVPDEVDFAGLGKMLAVTQNDLVNTVAAKTFAHYFGKKNVYQIRSSRKPSKRRLDLSESTRGRALFADGVDDQRLFNDFAGGNRCKATKLSAEFTWDHFRERYANGYVLFALVDNSGKLQISAADQVLKPAAGHTVIALVRETSGTGSESATQQATSPQRPQVNPV